MNISRLTVGLSDRILTLFLKNLTPVGDRRHRAKTGESQIKPQIGALGQSITDS